MILVHSKSSPDYHSIKKSFISAAENVFTNSGVRKSLEYSMFTSFNYMLEKLLSSENNIEMDKLEDVLGFGTLEIESNPRLEMDLDLGKVPELVLFGGSLRNRVILNHKLKEGSISSYVIHFLRDTVMRQSKLSVDDSEFIDPMQNNEKYAFICNRDFNKFEKLKRIFASSIDKKRLTKESVKQLGEVKQSLTSSSIESLKKISLIDDAFKFTKTNTSIELTHLFLVRDVQICTDLGIKLNDLVRVFSKQAISFKGQFTFGNVRDFLIADNRHIPEFEGEEMLSEIIRFEKPILMYVSLKEKDESFDLNPKKWFKSLRSFRDFKKAHNDPLIVINLDQFTFLKMHASKKMVGFGEDWNHYNLFKKLRSQRKDDFNYDEPFLLYFIQYKKGNLAKYVYTSEYGKYISGEGIQKFYFSISENKVKQEFNSQFQLEHEENKGLVRMLNIDTFNSFVLPSTYTKVILFVKDAEYSSDVVSQYAKAVEKYVNQEHKDIGRVLVLVNFLNFLILGLQIRFSQMEHNKINIPFVTKYPSIVVLPYNDLQNPILYRSKPFKEKEIYDFLESLESKIIEIEKIRKKSLKLSIDNIR